MGRFREAVKKTRLMTFVQNYRRKKVKDQFDTETLRFKNIDRVATKIKKEYEEDIYDQLAQRYVYRYMGRCRAEIEKTAKKLKEEIQPVVQPFTVFTMWWQGENEMPPLMKSCVNSLDKIGGRVVVITKDNYVDYVSLPDYIVSLSACGKMCLAHFSDIIRIRKELEELINEKEY